MSMATSDGDVSLYSGGGQRLKTSSVGGKTFGTWTNGPLSDGTLKSNVKTRDGINNILALNGVDWDWKDPKAHGEDVPTSGFIAQNYREVYPDRVGTGDVDDPFDSQHADKLRITSIQGDKTFDADVVEAIKFLHAEVQELKLQREKSEVVISELTDEVGHLLDSLASLRP